jgi:hypothetical protein
MSGYFLESEVLSRVQKKIKKGNATDPRIGVGTKFLITKFLSNCAADFSLLNLPKGKV